MSDYKNITHGLQELFLLYSEEKKLSSGSTVNCQYFKTFFVLIIKILHCLLLMLSLWRKEDSEEVVLEYFVSDSEDSISP